MRILDQRTLPVRRNCRLGAMVALAALVGLSGCGKPSAVFPVTGQVLLANGKPLSEGAVQFIPEPGGTLAYGTIGSDGSFHLTSLDKREGAVPGRYKVRIEPTIRMTAAPRGKKSRPLPFAERYTAEDGETGLIATVKAEPTQLEPFRLEVK